MTLSHSIRCGRVRGGGLTPTAYSAPRMSPALRAPPLFRCAEHTIDVIHQGGGSSSARTPNRVPEFQLRLMRRESRDSVVEKPI